MSADFDQVARLKFMIEYERTIQQLTIDVGAKVCEFNSKGILSSSMFFGTRNKLAIDTARSLSQKRLEIDLATLYKFDIPVKDQVGWLKSNQSTLLLEDFWKQIILGDFRNAKYVTYDQGYENAAWTELTNLRHQAERQIIAASLEPVALSQPSVHQTAYYNYGGQMNVAMDNSTINATIINNSAEIGELAVKLAELLKSSQLPAELKEEAVDLAETVAEQAKAGRPRKSILKSLGNTLKVVKDTITNTDAMLNAGRDLYNTATQLGDLLNRIS
jgi:hypothetical protein